MVHTRKEIMYLTLILSWTQKSLAGTKGNSLISKKQGRNVRVRKFAAPFASLASSRTHHFSEQRLQYNFLSVPEDLNLKKPPLILFATIPKPSR
jgi:hypothetical protein